MTNETTTSKAASMVGKFYKRKGVEDLFIYVESLGKNALYDIVTTEVCLVDCIGISIHMVDVSECYGDMVECSRAEFETAWLKASKALKEHFINQKIGSNGKDEEN